MSDAAMVFLVVCGLVAAFSIAVILLFVAVGVVKEVWNFLAIWR